MKITFGDMKDRYFERTKNYLENKYGYTVNQEQLKLIVNDVISYFDRKIMKTIIDTYIKEVRND